MTLLLISGLVSTKPTHCSQPT